MRFITGQRDHVELREPVAGEERVELVEVEAGAREDVLHDGPVERFPVQPPQLHVVAGPASLQTSKQNRTENVNTNEIMVNATSSSSLAGTEKKKFRELVCPYIHLVIHARKQWWSLLRKGNFVRQLSFADENTPCRKAASRSRTLCLHRIRPKAKGKASVTGSMYKRSVPVLISSPLTSLSQKEKRTTRPKPLPSPQKTRERIGGD